MPNRDDIILAARSWLGRPWRHQGRSSTGVDCAGLVVLVARSLGLADHDVSGYRRTPHAGRFVAAFREAMEEIRIADLKTGDVILFADGISPCHVAFYVAGEDQPWIIHAHALRRKVVEEIYTADWQKIAIHAFRCYGVAD
ncbi:C40 family peptidase [Emcibacteraceae bacterium Y4]|uniref:C40 family peptidase n=1 Tax=Pseudemcibacter aquimaris TaxID=2857064 RepID=UPI0020117156|nr:NlpC/P60 family protein [Pseudemcibacter aquimaris]MCC3862539.1 C40 family peptidase [Pseudemcibacter aquimaris]